MAKKIKFESFRFQFLAAAEQLRFEATAASGQAWDAFLRSLKFEYDRGTARISWADEPTGSLSWALDEPAFYRRGDRVGDAAPHADDGADSVRDRIKQHNQTYFRNAVEQVASAAGYRVERSAAVERRLSMEREFHDGWASGEDIDAIDPIAANEACTIPEMRYIRSRLGDLRGKRLLDVGCGLGEASVYFAILGAHVTAADLSQGMLNATVALGKRHGVDVMPHLAAAEDLKLPADARFDVIYAGNLLHHVDIEQTLARLQPHLAADGVLVTWDPVAYNPLINIYRAIAKDVRTPDEHPLTWRDIKSFRKFFRKVESRYFWLTTLVIFLLMFVVQRRDPNRERFWKVVVRDADKWRPVYLPLERLDRVLLRFLPPLRLLCWNVVVIARP